MNLTEQVSKMKELIYELSPHSNGVQDFFDLVEKNPELVKHLQFSKLRDLKDFVYEASYKEFNELKKEANAFINKKKK